MFSLKSAIINIQNELNKLKKIPLKEKAWYIWEYYKFHIIVCLFLISISISILSNVLA